MDIKDIQNLIKFVAKSGAQEVKLEMEDIKITIKTGSDQPLVETTGMVQQIQTVPAPVQLQSAPAVAVPEAVAPVAEKAEVILLPSNLQLLGPFIEKQHQTSPILLRSGIRFQKGMFCA